MMTVQMPDGVSHGGSAVLQSPSGFVPPSSKGMDKFMELYYEEQHSNASHSDGSGDEEDDGDSNNMQVRSKGFASLLLHSRMNRVPTEYLASANPSRPRTALGRELRSAGGSRRHAHRCRAAPNAAPFSPINDLHL